MRLRLIVPLGMVVVLCHAAPVRAESFQYYFAGTLPASSFLQYATGEIVDLSQAAFVASGIAEGQEFGAAGANWIATTFYDFGPLGSFQTGLGDENLLIHSNSDFLIVELIHWHLGTLEDLGFTVAIPLTESGTVDPLTPNFFQLQPAAASASGAIARTNGAGDTFYTPGPPGMGFPMTVSEVTVHPAPEPSALALTSLATLSLVAFGLRHRRRDQ